MADSEHIEDFKAKFDELVNSVKQFNDSLKKLKDNGTAVLISTHIIDIIDDIYDEAYIMDKGVLKAHVIKGELNSVRLKDEFLRITAGDEKHE